MQCFKTVYLWSGLINPLNYKTIDVNTAFKEFNDVLQWHVETYIPKRTVHIKQRDPMYVTPLIKLLLMKRNRLRHKGRLDEANVLARKINTHISDNRKNILSSASQSDTTKLWSLLHSTNNWGTKINKFSSCGSADDINNFFATVASSQDYSKDNIMNELCVSETESNSSSLFVAYYSDFETFVKLSKLRETSTGSDDIPYWVLRYCAGELSTILAKLINYSINEGIVPNE